jgi:uncharacterized protein (TIGR02266 family)
MSYSGAQTAKTSRENLGRALAALQEDPNIPPDVLAIAQNIAQAMAALFEAERAAGEPEGKAAVKRGLGVVGQTLALLQDVRGQHRGIQMATESIAQTMSALYPLTTKASMLPPAMPAQGMGGAPMMGQPAPGYAPPQQPLAPGVAYAATQVQQPKPAQPQQAWQPAPHQPPQQQAWQPPQQQANPYAAPAIPTTSPAQPAYQAPQAGAYRAENKERIAAEVNIGANTDSNFYVGFSGEISEGGVFCATYNIQPRGTAMRVLVTLPGNFEKHVNGFVRFVRDPMDLTAESEPGMGIQFEGLDPEARDLILRFIRKRAPMFYDE